MDVSMKLKAAIFFILHASKFFNQADQLVFSNSNEDIFSRF